MVIVGRPACGLARHISQLVTPLTVAALNPWYTRPTSCEAGAKIPTPALVTSTDSLTWFAPGVVGIWVAFTRMFWIVIVNDPAGNATLEKTTVWLPAEIVP